MINMVRYNQGVPCDDKHINTVNKRLSYIKREMSRAPPKSIVDLGVGVGVYAKTLSETTDRYVGIDIDTNNVKCTIHNAPKSQCLQASAEEIPLQSGTFEMAIMIEVLEHIPDDNAAIRETFRMLKPGGVFIVTAPNKLFPMETHGARFNNRVISSKGLGIPILPWLPDTIRNHCCNARVYTPWQFKKILNEAGFKVTSIDFIAPGMDQANYSHKWLSNIFRILGKCFNKLERNRFSKQFMATVIITAVKPDCK